MFLESSLLSVSLVEDQFMKIKFKHKKSVSV